MANTVGVQFIEDGQRYCIVRLIGVLDTSDEAYTIKVDPDSLSSMQTDGYVPPTGLRIREIEYAIEDGLVVNLWWDTGGGSGQYIMPIYGRGRGMYRDYGDIKNTALGATGSIALSTKGFTSGQVQTYSLTLELIKTNETLQAATAQGPMLSFDTPANSQYWPTFI